MKLRSCTILQGPIIVPSSSRARRGFPKNCQFCPIDLSLLTEKCPLAMASPHVDASPTSSRPASQCDFDMTGAPPLHPQFNEDTDDTDSVYGEDSLTRDETKTLSTFVTEYRYEFGRRYHAFRDGAYWVCGGSHATWIRH